MAALNSTASVKEVDGRKEIVGNATECAILKLSRDLGGNRSVGEGCNRKEFMPFSSVDKNSKSIVQTKEGQHFLLITGAPERQFEKCAMVHTKGDTGKQCVEEDWINKQLDL